MKFRGMLKAVPLERCTALAWGGGLGAAVGCGFLPWWTILLILPGIFMLGRCPRVMFCFALILSLISGSLHLRREKIISEIYPDSAMLSGIFTVRDSRATKVKGIVPDFRIRGEFIADGAPEAVSVLAELPDDLKVSGVLYGERFRVEAILQVPSAAGFYFDGSRISGEVPPPYGKSTLLKIEKISPLETESGFRRWCFLLRENLLKHLISGIRNKETSSMAARLFLGAADGGTISVRRNFVTAGIIHIFAVSGMHVGVLAVVAGMVLGFLPFRQRHILLAVIVSLYVMCSGLAIPALRAGAMIVGWCLLRAFLFYTPNWNILTLAFFVLTVTTPEAVGDLGTQYSFGITAALILGLPIVREYLDDTAIYSQLMVNSNIISRKFRKYAARFRRLVIFISAAVIAFAASSMLTILHNNLFIPGSIITNLLTALITPFMFAVFLFKLLFSWSAGMIDICGARLLEWCFALLKGISEFSLEIFSSVTVVEPDIHQVAIFYMLFFAALVIRKFYIALALMTGAIVLLMLTVLTNPATPDEVVVLGGSSGHPPVIIYVNSARSTVLVCDLPDSWSAALAAGEVKRRGRSEAEIFFSGSRSHNNSGLAAFAFRVTPLAIHPLAGKPTLYFTRNLEQLEAVSSRLVKNFADRRLPQISSASERWQWSPDVGVVISVLRGDDGWNIQVKFRSGKTESVTIPWNNHVLIWNITE